MRLLIAADIFPPESGGPATYAVTLANELAKQGARVKIVSLTKKSDRSVLNGKIKFWNVHFSKKYKLLRYFEYAFFLWWSAWRADVIYAMGPVNAGKPALWAHRLCPWKIWKRKFFVKVVGDYAWEQGVTFCGIKETIDEFQKKVDHDGYVGKLQNTERLVCKRADRIIVPCNYLKNIVIGWGSKPEKVEVIYNAVEFVDVAATPKPVGEKWIVSVARLLPWKGMGMLIEIMPEIIKQIPEVKLKIVGEGPEFNNLKLEIRNLKLDNYVELTGQLSKIKTLGYIKSADVFVLNSGYEGLSHVILEAYSFGKPVLASDCGGNNEVIIEGFPGALFKFNDQKEIIEKIINYIKDVNNNLASPEQLKVFMQEKYPLSRMINQTHSELLSLCAS